MAWLPDGAKFCGYDYSWRMWQTDRQYRTTEYRPRLCITSRDKNGCDYCGIIRIECGIIRFNPDPAGVGNQCGKWKTTWSNGVVHLCGIFEADPSRYRVGHQGGIWRVRSDYDRVGYQSVIICSRLDRRVVRNYCGHVFSGDSRSTGCGGIWRSYGGKV